MPSFSRPTRAGFRHATRLPALILALAALAQSPSVNAQQAQASVPVQPAPNAPRVDAGNPIVHLQTTDLRHFDKVFSALSEQGKIAFVAEGKPFISTLSDDDLDKLTKSLPTGDAATLEVVTDVVAHAFDYDVVRTPTQPTLVLLLKRYSNPKDFPMVSYEEAERSLHNILLATNSLHPRAPFSGKPGSPFNTLYSSLTSEQRAKMVNPMPVADLRPEQRQIVWQLAHQSYFTSMEAFDNVYSYLKGLEDPRTEFCWMDWTKSMASDVPLFVFGWEGPFGPNHGNHKVALSHLSVDPGGPTSLAIPFNAAVASGLLDAKTGHLLKPLPDNGTEPTPADAANATPEKPFTEPDPNMFTLREAVQHLNEATASVRLQPGEAMFRAAVDDALVRKTVTLIGTQNTPPFNLLDAFSRVYGLWIVAQKEKSYLLTLRAPRPCKQAADVPQEIRRLFPEPMWRAVESGARSYENSPEEQAIKKRWDDARPKRFPGKLPDDFLQGLARQDARLAEAAKVRIRARAAQAMNVESIRRIRALVEPSVPKNSGKRLPVVNVGDEAHDALAIFHLTQAAQTLDDSMNRPVPPFLLNFDRATIQALVGTISGPDYAAYDIGVIDEKGIPRPNFSMHFQMKQR